MENELKTKLLNDAINTLSSPANEIFKARLIDGLKYKEIANRLDITLSLVKNTCYALLWLYKNIYVNIMNEES